MPYLSIETRASLVAALSVSACMTPAPAESPVAASPVATAAGVEHPPSAKACAWPGGAEVAVSLTYDDSLASQVRYAVPVLDRAGLKATFFLSGTNLALFAPLAKSGHELASHTVTHPCRDALAALSLDDMAKELDAGVAALQALGVSGKLTFAYPCGEMHLKGGSSYEPLVHARFRAARGVAGTVADPQSVNLFNAPAFFPPTNSDGSDVVAFIEQARKIHGWAVIGIHGVSAAGEYLQLPQAAHDKIVDYLTEHAQTVWTAPFGTVADTVVTCRR